MPDALTIAKLINSSPGQLAAGGAWQAISVHVCLGLGLFYGVMKFFDAVGDRLNDDTKLEIAVWLLGRKKFSPSIQNWPDTFTQVFNRVFGSRYLSLRGFTLSVVSSFTIGLLLTIYMPSPYRTLPWLRQLREALVQQSVTLICGKVLVDYLSLLLTRLILSWMTKFQNGVGWFLLLVLDIILVGYLGIVGLTFGLVVGTPVLKWLDSRYFVATFPWQHVVIIASRVPQHPIRFVLAAIHQPHIWPLLASGFMTSTWLWLYTISGYLLKAAHRFDAGFEWFNRHCDIEKKPLQSIGLVAGALVAVAYWAAVIVGKVMG